MGIVGIVQTRSYFYINSYIDWVLNWVWGLVPDVHIYPVRVLILAIILVPTIFLFLVKLLKY